MSKLIFDTISNLPQEIKGISFSRLFVLVDKNTKESCYPLVEKLLPSHQVIEITPGEQTKDLRQCMHIWDKLTEAQADRNTLLLNLGGGVVTDMGGFCAGTYKRGIRFINVPTTLLAQVDASTGGKTGVDYQGFKNHIGVFNEPEFVFIDQVFHKTLPKRELASGFAEMLKHGLIKDEAHWKHLIAKGYEQIDLATIQHSVAIKQAVVTTDPLEKGERKILNFGHTIGHAIESDMLYTEHPLLHGEAIALGMIMEAYIALQKGLIVKEAFEEIESSIKKYYSFPEIKKASRDNILRLCKQDKKNDKGIIQMSLLEKIGQANFNISVEAELIEQALAACL